MGLPCSCVRVRGALLVSGGEDKAVKLWALSPTGGECVATLLHGDTAVKGVALSPSGFVASSGGDGARALVVWGPAAAAST